MNRALISLLLALGVSASLSALAAQNGTYRWYDENGTVHYSDVPPEGVEAEFIKFASSGKSKEETATDANAQPGDDQTAGDKSKVYDKMEAMPPKDPELCKKAKANLKALEGARIRITEPDGTKRILTEEEKEIQRENARKFIKINC